MIGLAGPDDVVRIYSGDLPSGSFSEPLKNTKAKEILIVLDDDSKLQWLESFPPSCLERIKVRKISRPRPNHFFSVSSGAFRFETEAATFRAEANFNEPETSEKLTKAFERYWTDATPVSLVQA